MSKKVKCVCVGCGCVVYRYKAHVKPSTKVKCADCRTKGKQKYTCLCCSSIILRYKSAVRNPEKVFCDGECHSVWAKETKAYAGKNNANYEKTWTDTQRKKAGVLISKRYEDLEYRYNIGKSNRGKRLSSEIRKKMSVSSMGGTGHKHTEEQKKRIGIQSAAKWKDPAYKKRHRKIMEDRGYWVRIEDKPTLVVFYKEANWIHNMFPLITDKKQLILLKENGVFSSKGKNKNTKGVVRDHIYSRRSGFKHGVFPQILRHPCNCQLLTCADNVSKAFGAGRYKDSDHQTLKTLFNNIRSYAKQWNEQILILNLIKDYENGKRWERRI